MILGGTADTPGKSVNEPGNEFESGTVRQVLGLVKIIKVREILPLSFPLLASLEVTVLIKSFTELPVALGVNGFIAGTVKPKKVITRVNCLPGFFVLEEICATVLGSKKG